MCFQILKKEEEKIHQPIIFTKKQHDTLKKNDWGGGDLWYQKEIQQKGWDIVKEIP